MLNVRPEPFKELCSAAHVHCLKEKHLLAPGTTFYLYQDYERELRQFFTFQDKSSLVYRNDIVGLIESMDIAPTYTYQVRVFYATEWRLFIDSFTAFLLHNWNSFPSIPVGHSYKWKKYKTAWIICCLLLTTRSINGLFVEILRWSEGSKVSTQSILIFCVSETAWLTTNIMSH